MTTEAYAKVNLTLEVFGVRGDGYHAIRSLVVPVSLSDSLEIEPSSELSSDTGFPDDLVVKAARVLDPSRGAEIRVTKRIPVGGGLGGGSADAAAALVALNDMWGAGHSRESLAKIAAHVGSDVPALILGGPVVMQGRGEVVERVACPRLDLVVANPGVHSSTREVYAHCSERDPAAPSATEACLAALAGGDLGRIAASLANDLAMSACRLHPEIADALASLRTAGALGATVSGSGSSVFGLAESAAQAAEIAGELRRKGLAAWPVASVSAGDAGFGTRHLEVNS